MSLAPSIQQSPIPGLVFDRSQGHQFKALTSSWGCFYWKPELMGLIRRCQELAYFLPIADFSDSGGRVVFTRYSGNDELLTKTIGFDQPGVKMPESVYAKLQEALAKFKAMANDATLSPDEARFIAEFKLPDRHRFPGAYRILKTNWYSADRLFVLWGLEPSANEAMPVIKLLAGPAGSPLPDQPSAGPMGGGGGAGSSGLGASSSRGGIPVGGSAGGLAGYGRGSSVQGEVAPAGEDVWRRWRGCLWLLVPFLLLLLLLLLITQCTPVSCSDSSQERYDLFADKSKAREPSPSVPVPGPGPSPAPGPGPSPGPSPSPTPGPAPTPGPVPSPSPGPGPAPAPGPAPMPGPTPGPGPSPSPSPTPMPAPAPSPGPLPPSGPKPDVIPPAWWLAEPIPEENKTRSGRVVPLPKRQPKSPGRFEVYIHEPTEFIQTPPSAGVHLGLRHHGEGRIKNVMWILADGVQKQGEFLDELVPFDRDLAAITEIDVAYTYVDSNGTETTDGFSFRYVLQGRVTFSEGLGAPKDKRTPAEKQKERKDADAANAATKGT